MLARTENLIQAGVDAKRKGNFRQAVEYYQQAIEIEPEPNSIMYISLAKSQYLMKDDNCFESYMRGLYHQILEYTYNSKYQNNPLGNAEEAEMLSQLFGIPSNSVNINRLLDKNYQAEFLEKFHNTLTHLAHAYLDFDNNKLIKFSIDIFNSFNSDPDYSLYVDYPPIEEMVELVEYTANKYRYDLAGGGISNPPTRPAIRDEYDINIDGCYTMNGTHIALSTINWESLKNSLQFI